MTRHERPKLYELPAEKKIEIPEGGWRERTCYEVMISMRPSNPAFKAIFYSGFLNGEGGSPGGYARIWVPGDSDTIEFQRVYYMRVLHEFVHTEQTT